MRRKRTGRIDRSCNFCRKQDVYPRPDDWNADSLDEIEFDSSDSFGSALDEDSVISDDHMIGLMQGNLVSGRKQASSIRKGGRREPVKFPKGDGGDSDTDSDFSSAPNAKRRQVRTMKQIMADADRMDEDFGDTSDSDDSVPQRPAAAAASARAASARAASAPAGPTARATLKGQERPVAGSNLPFPGVKRVVTKAYDGFATHLLHLAYQRKMHLVFTNEQRQWNQFYNEAIRHEF
ncbi:hypothetical protein THAOC_24089, partial [Thalassiosira oceanica]